MFMQEEILHNFFFISVDLESLAQCSESANEDFEKANFATFGFQNHYPFQCEMRSCARNVCPPDA